MGSFLDNKTLLITGGTGSFGHVFTHLVLNEHKPKAIRIYSRSELPQVEMERDCSDPRLRFLIGDVRDKERLYRAMSGVDIVVHTAALKHVPVCEYNPIEAIRTNILGAVNVVECAIEHKVEKVIALSTDKAVAPLNLYGATKAVSEKLFIQANSYSGGRLPKFSVVRYGNVANSRGSILPLLRQQEPQGEFTLTDPRMTRFWITLEQGVRFTLFSLEQMVGGEVFIPKLPSIRVQDLMSAVGKDIPVKVTGIRPGEKLSEVLFTDEEVCQVREFVGYYVLQPQFSFWREGTLIGGSTVPDGFTYCSDKGLLSKEEVAELVREM